MAAQKGREILIKRDSGGSVFVTVGGMRQKSCQINGAPAADVSDSDSTWTERLEGAGLKDFSISGAGVFKDSASENAVLTDLLNDTATAYQFIVPGLGTFTATMICTGISYAGEYQGEVNYNMGWASKGEVVKS